MPDDTAPEAVPVRRLPTLPATDPELGDISWERWEPALHLSHFDPSCATCAYPGPLSTTFGQTHYTPQPTWERIQRSSREHPSRWAKRQHKPYWCRTHWAIRCPACDEMTVYRRDPDWQEIHYHPPATERSMPATEDNVLF